ncbi:MAG: hypothetical protein JSW05_05475 [Candidatus Thorarchaeota archaeon]|nr:MAG: hypothetical protein JSW05_05475 [Candidatus Thorarchaeota archaeon]
MPSNDEDYPFGILIPIAVLVIVMVYTGVGWIMIPIGILVIVFFSEAAERRRIDSRRREIDYWKAPQPGTQVSGYVPEGSPMDTKPIYDRTKRKDEGVAFGTLIPIFIMGWLYISTDSWVFLIPLAVLVISFLGSIANSRRGSAEVRDEIQRGDARTVGEIADRTGMPEERVRRHIVRDKRSGTSDVWFDSSTGEAVPSPIRVVEPEPVVSGAGCKYCGFALKSDDRFCPFCGAPVRLE